MKNIEDMFDREMNICTHFGEDQIGNYSPMAPPIVQTSTFRFDSYEDFLNICDDEKIAICTLEEQILLLSY